MFEDVGHSPPGELLLDEGASVLAEGGSLLWVFQKAEDFLRDIVWVFGARKEAGLSVEDDFRRAVEGIGDDGDSRGKCLHAGAGEAFAEGEMREDRHERRVAADLAGGNQSREEEVAFQSECLYLRAQLRLEDAVAEEQKTRFRFGGDDLRGGFHEDIVALEWEWK